MASDVSQTALRASAKLNNLITEAWNHTPGHSFINLLTSQILHTNAVYHEKYNGEQNSVLKLVVSTLGSHCPIVSSPITAQGTINLFHFQRRL